MKIYLITIFVLALTLIASATPYPGMGSSILVDPTVGAFLAAKGFTVKTTGTPWVPVAQNENSLIESVRFELKNTENLKSTATLALRIDDIGNAGKLDIYAKKWIKEYSQFGFEILGSQNAQLDGNESLVIDLLQKNKMQQIRQVLIRNNKQVAIFTCNDKKVEFAKTLPACNQVVRSFKWSKTTL